MIYVIKKFLLLASLFLKSMIKQSPLQFRTRENFIKTEAEIGSAEPSTKRTLRTLCCYRPSEGGGLGLRHAPRVNKAARRRLREVLADRVLADIPCAVLTTIQQELGDECGSLLNCWHSSLFLFPCDYSNRIRIIQNKQ